VVVSYLEKYSNPTHDCMHCASHLLKTGFRVPRKFLGLEG
jgi:hypothetical protein